MKSAHETLGNWSNEDNGDYLVSLTSSAVMSLGLGSSLPEDLGIFTCSVPEPNRAPLLNAAGSPTLDQISQNLPAANNPGTLVTEIISRMAPNGGITDPDAGALQGIAINGLTNVANGSWEYTIDNGVNWALIGTTGNANGRSCRRRQYPYSFRPQHQLSRRS